MPIYFNILNFILVYGATLGRQKGRNIELCTSFEIKMKKPSEETEFDEEIDLEFLNTQISQCKLNINLYNQHFIIYTYKK